MQQIGQRPVAPQPSAQQRTLRIAWAALVGFFLLFVLLVGWAGVLTYRYVVEATDPRDATLIVRGPADWIAWQPANRTIFQGVVDQQLIGEGDAVRIVSSAGYGQVASLKLFEESQLDLWAGAELRLETLRTSRWNQQVLEVGLRQSGGYVRYDIKQPPLYAELRYQVTVGKAVIELAPGGSYSIELRRPQRQVQLVDTENPLVADVAVRSGRAVVAGPGGLHMILTERQRVEIDPAGIPGLAVPARWELIRDGGFSQFDEVEYNNTTRQDDPTLPRSDSWQVYSGPRLPAEESGYFRLQQVCRPPLLDGCSAEELRTAAWFYRTGGQTRSFTTGIEQQLGPDGAGVDISEYRTLVLSVWAQVVDQSLEDVGDQGTECPVMIRLLARRTSPADSDQQRVICVYTDANALLPRVTSDEVYYVRITRDNWHEIRLNLRDTTWLPDYRYLRSIQIFAQGHDYDSRVTAVSLVGEQ